MKFDKSKIFTVVTGSRELEGKTGWLGDTLTELMEKVKKQDPEYLLSFHETWSYPFEGEDYYYTLFYPAPEPTYRPFNNNELNDLVGEILTNKQSGRRKLVTGKPTEALGVNLDGSYITAKDLLSSFYRNTDEPCGIKEEV